MVDGKFFDKLEAVARWVGVRSNNRHEFPYTLRLLPSYGFVVGYKAAIGMSGGKSENAASIKTDFFMR